MSGCRNQSCVTITAHFHFNNAFRYLIKFGFIVVNDSTAVELLRLFCYPYNK